MTDNEKKELGKNLTIGAAVLGGAALTNHGLYAGFKHFAPGLMGNRGWFLGPATGVKRSTSTLANYVSKGKLGKSLHANLLGTDKIFHVTLAPTEIRKRSEIMAARNIKDFDKLTPLEKYENSKRYDIIATKMMLDEQEALARTQGAEYLVGQSHFTPAMVARFGYQDAPELTRAGNELIWPNAYYRTNRKATLSQIEQGKELKDLNEMDAYWLTVNPKTVRLFKKSLKDTPANVRQTAQDYYKKIDPDYNLYLNEEEVGFKSRFDELVKDIKGKQ